MIALSGSLTSISSKHSVIPPQLADQSACSLVSYLWCRELPVRVEAVMALRSFVEELADVAPLRPVLAQLMDSIFKLMNEVGYKSLL